MRARVDVGTDRFDGGWVVLVVGATGALGSEICRQLAGSGRAVRALVRRGSAPERVAALRELGEVVEGDLRDRSSLDRACAGTKAVISTATSIMSRRGDDSFAATDRDGQLALIGAAIGAAATRFVYVSFPELDVRVPLQDAKRAVEQRLRESGLVYTILRPGNFYEIWLSPMLGFDAANGTVRIFGAGDRPLNWISVRDVARAAVVVLDDPQARRSVLELASAYLSPLAVVSIFERAAGRAFTREHIAEEALQAAVDTAPDEVAQTLAGLGLGTARGHARDGTANLTRLGVRATSVQEYAGMVLRR
jgi:uncharacterized protein YbjT (DUF2867 family)